MSHFLSNYNDSILIGEHFKEEYGYTVLVIWHEAKGDSWPDFKQDEVSFIWTDSGNTSEIETMTYSEFRERFIKLHPNPYFWQWGT